MTVCRWMGWSYADLLDAPDEIVTEIAMMLDEQQQHQQRGEAA